MSEKDLKRYRNYGVAAVGLVLFSVFLLTKLDFTTPRVGDNSFSRGFFRQFWGPDHLALCIAVGIYCYRLMRRAFYAFLLPFFLAGIVGYGAVFIGPSELHNQALTLLLRFLCSFGVSIALGALGLQFLRKVEAKPSFVRLLAIFSGFCNGMQHAVEMPVYLNPPLYGLGVVFSTLLLMLGGAVVHYILARSPSKSWDLVALRLLGFGLIGVGVLTAADAASRSHFTVSLSSRVH